MLRMRSAPLLSRVLFGAVLALLLGLRSLAPAGFMPAFDHGAVTIVACPDGEMMAPISGSHHAPGSKGAHQLCPYAAASTAGTVSAPVAPSGPALVFDVPEPPGLRFLFLQPRAERDRPPATGPPILA